MGFVYVFVRELKMKKNKYMNIAVGTKNKVKIQAVRKVMLEYLDSECYVLGLKAPSGVRDMPLSDEEAILEQKIVHNSV